jgi:hypothetical protein
MIGDDVMGINAQGLMTDEEIQTTATTQINEDMVEEVAAAQFAAAAGAAGVFAFPTPAY